MAAARRGLSLQQRDAYVRFDPFEGDRDVDVRCRVVKIVRTRRVHRCISPIGRDALHEMPAGTMARYEHALVEGEWRSFYVCAACMDAWLAMVAGPSWVKPTRSETSAENLQMSGGHDA